METAARNVNAIEDRSAILYPLMVIAAVAVIAFSAMGMATMLGWMPETLTLSSAAPASRSAEAASSSAKTKTAPPGATVRAASSS
jgi:hypothetical protein